MVRCGSGRIADAAKGDQSSEAEWSASDDIGHRLSINNIETCHCPTSNPIPKHDAFIAQYHPLPTLPVVAFFNHTCTPPLSSSITLANPDTADFVQELYLKELKAYKPAAVKDSDAQGQVQTFSVPQTPKSPEETDLAASLKEYESMAVEVEGQDAAVAAGGQPAQHDWLMIEEDEEEPHH